MRAGVGIPGPRRTGGTSEAAEPSRNKPSAATLRAVLKKMPAGPLEKIIGHLNRSAINIAFDKPGKTPAVRIEMERDRKWMKDKKELKEVEEVLSVNSFKGDVDVEDGDDAEPQAQKTARDNAFTALKLLADQGNDLAKEWFETAQHHPAHHPGAHPPDYTHGNHTVAGRPTHTEGGVKL